MFKYLGAVLARWLPMALVISFSTILIYGGGQQSYRQNADDPQIQIARDTAWWLHAGRPMEQLLPKEPVAIETSLASYLIIFDTTGQALTGTGQLHGQLPTVPYGVLDVADEEGENRVTWQPEPGVRSAIVVVPYQYGATRGYVLAGRSLMMVEDRIGQLGLWCFLAGGAGLVAALGLAGLLALGRPASAHPTT